MDYDLSYDWEKSGFYDQTYSYLDLFRGRGGRQSPEDQLGFIFTEQSGRTNSGEQVQVDNLLEDATVVACINAITQGITQIPVYVRKSSDAGDYEILKDHPISKLMKRPNDYQTATEFKSSIVTAMLTHGNAFIYLARVGDKGGDTSGKPTTNTKGRVVQMYPMDPSDITIGSNAFGRPSYHHEEQGLIPTENIVHIRDLNTYTPQGLSRALLAAERIGSLKAADRLMAETFRTGQSFQYVISTTDALDADAKENMLKQMGAVFGPAGSRRGGVVLLENGSVDKIDGIKPADVDLRALREQLIREIAAVFRVPAFMVGAAEGQTYNNVRQYWTAFHRDTLQPLVTNIEEALTLKLLGEGEYLHFDVQEILKGDVEITSRVASTLVSNGIISPNEGREMMGVKRHEGETADDLIAPNSTTNLNLEETPENATGGGDGPQGQENIDNG